QNHQISMHSLAGQTPRERTTYQGEHTKLVDVALHKKLFEAGKQAVEATKDPMIELAQLVDQPARDVRKIIETQGEVKQQAHAKIAKARFALEGTSTYPDATFTLRLAFGTVSGYQEGGKFIAPHTTFAGLYERATEQE